MEEQNEFVGFVIEDALALVGNITSKRMFGGFGLYRDDVFFAIVDEGRLFFKVDEKSRRLFEEAGSSPFTYNRQDKEIIMETYWEVPAHVLEDRKMAARWALAACRAGKKASAR